MADALLNVEKLSPTSTLFDVKIAHAEGQAMPIKILASLLSSLQNVVAEIHRAITGGSPANPASELRFVTTYEGSTGLILIVAADTSDDTGFGSSATALVPLLESVISRPPSDVAPLARHPFVFPKLLTLLNVFCRIGVPVEFMSSNRADGSTALTAIAPNVAHRVRKGLQGAGPRALQGEELPPRTLGAVAMTAPELISQPTNVRGRFLAVSLRNGSFEFEDDAGLLYSGVLAPVVRTASQRIAFDVTYTVRLVAAHGADWELSAIS
jgi:hypothetical protein